MATNGDPAAADTAPASDEATQRAKLLDQAHAAGVQITDSAAILDFLTHFRTFVTQSQAAFNNAHIQNADQHERDAQRQDRHEKLRKQQDELREADVWVEDVTKCDGRVPSAVRTWITQVERTIPYTTATVRVAMRSVTGYLRRDLERFLGAGDRSHITWKHIKTYVVGHFLPPQDQERLRAEVDCTIQTAYESTLEFNRRFKEAVSLAYPTTEDDVDHAISDRYIVRAYIHGLRNRHLAEKVVRRGIPRSLDDAIKAVEKMEASEADVVNMFPTSATTAPPPRKEEPMDISALAAPRPSPPTQRDTDLAELKRQVSGLSRQFNQMWGTFANVGATKTRNARSRPRPPGPSQQVGRFQFSDDGKPICAYCNKKGHVRRECRKRMADQAQQAQGGQ